MGVAEDARATGRLAGTGTGGLEDAHVDAAANQLVRRGEPRDPGPDDGHLGRAPHLQAATAL